MAVQGLFLTWRPGATAVGRGYANQRGLERLVAIEDRCSPESGNCGPTRCDQTSLQTTQVLAARY
eukprot:2567117-Rhodomonas_salina.2